MAYRLNSPLNERMAAYATRRRRVRRRPKGLHTLSRSSLYNPLVYPTRNKMIVPLAPCARPIFYSCECAQDKYDSQQTRQLPHNNEQEERWGLPFEISTKRANGGLRVPSAAGAPYTPPESK